MRLTCVIADLDTGVPGGAKCLGDICSYVLTTALSDDIDVVAMVTGCGTTGGTVHTTGASVTG